MLRRTTHPDLRFEMTPGGDVCLRGVRLTEASGWIELQVPRADASEPTQVVLRLMVAPREPQGRWLCVEQLRVGWMRYAGLHSVAAIEGTTWLAALSAALREAIAAQLAAAGDPLGTELRASETQLLTERRIESGMRPRVEPRAPRVDRASHVEAVLPAADRDRAASARGPAGGDDGDGDA